MDVAAISACPTGSGPEHRLAVLSAGSELGWVDAGGSVGDTERVAPFWRRLAGGSHGVLAGTGEVTGIVPGRFLEDGTQVAVATRSGVVSVLDETDGSILYRAIVGAPARVAAADLDRDGLDELAISWGSRVAVLGAARRESVGASSDSAKVEILQESSVTESKEDME